MNRDVGVTELVRTMLPEWAVPVFELIALLGDVFVVVGVLLVVAVVDVQRSVRDGSDQLLSNRTAFVLAIVLGGLALTLVLKAAFGAPRPPSSLQAVPRDGDGFPSGHTMAATVLWVALARWGQRFTARRRYQLAALAVGLVGVSRLALGVHYVVDVVASVAFGLAYLSLATRLTKQNPTLAFVGASLLGGLAVVVTGGSVDGWLAFVGCAGGATTWWSVRRWSALQSASSHN
ncbi:phosphatase PAP2 family protein [Natronobeatus ordinarius]|uniref:phosphatase PAP2 family protein n=1 Tax=Natronobeatus ordinarius TaxID=2963433 RepID=UPI0020CE08D7|nr:phosphatase PAP2 family protein [Natronobeatus ordinarius]